MFPTAPFRLLYNSYNSHGMWKGRLGPESLPYLTVQWLLLRWRGNDLLETKNVSGKRPVTYKWLSTNELKHTLCWPLVLLQNPVPFSQDSQQKDHYSAIKIDARAQRAWVVHIRIWRKTGFIYLVLQFHTSELFLIPCLHQNKNFSIQLK